jgi:hypothetical protein
MKVLSLIALSLLLSRCSESTNVNQLFVSDGQKESFTYLMEEAQMSYDQGEFSDALGYATKAYKINPESESASVLLGYIYLSVAGIDTFQLASNLMASDDEKSDSTTLIAEKKDASDALTKLAGIIGISDDELASLTVTEVDGVSGTSDSDIFEGMDIVFPLSAVEAREGEVEALVNLAKSLNMVCSWVDDEVKVTVENDKSVDDPRHVAESCTQSEHPRYLTSKAHYLWALSHLSEAIVFNTVISTNMPNLLARAEAISSRTSIDPQTYVDSVIELADVTNTLLPTDPEISADSMLTGLFNDLEAVTLGFAALPGIPEKMTKPVSDALEKLREQAGAIEAAGTTDLDPNAGALRDQLTKKFAAKLKTQIEEREENGDFTAEQKEQACEAYGKITTVEIDTCSE